MKLEDARFAHIDFSSRASDISRQLSFALIAVVWIFKTDRPDGSMSIPHALYLPATLVIAALAVDLLQYIYGSIAWDQIFHAKEVELDHNEETEFTVSRWVNRPTFLAFYVKLTLVVASYLMLLKFLGSKIA
jgi:hypothetical protein